jgi:hypothetical protein
MNSRIEEILIPDSVSAIALCGGPYNNFEAVKSFLDQTAKYEFRFCLGDLGGFGPYPDRTIDLIRNSNIHCLQGNYDYAIGNSEPECGCGYLNPLDRKFSQLSFDYTMKKTSAVHRPWLRDLPGQIEVSWRGKKIRLCHGSPIEVNEFIWESETTDDRIAGWLEKFGVDGFCATHSGLPWIRQVGEQKGFWMNVGVLGRPAHEGLRSVYYATISLESNQLRPTLHHLDYDYNALIAEMRAENLPEEFCQALLKGVWTTCYNILPAKENEVALRS